MRPEGWDGLFTEQQLWQFYVRFNEVYFRNTLPLPTKISYCDGMTRACPDRVAVVFWEGRTGTDYHDYRIYFLHRFFRGRDPRLVLCALLHEMVHIYVHRFASSEFEDHGPMFKAACKKLQRLGWNVDLSLNPHLLAFKLQERRDDVEDFFFNLFGFIGRVLRSFGNRR